MKTKTLILTLLFINFFALAFGQVDNKVKKDSCIKIPDILSTNTKTKLFVTVSCQITKFEFKLFNRWGNLVYTTDKLTNPLDLNIFEKITEKKQEKQKYAAGVYYWIVNYTAVIEGKLNEKKATGNLTISY